MPSQLPLFNSTAATSTSSPAEPPASPTPSPVASSAKKTRGTSGRKWRESLPKSGPLGFFSRMFLTFRRPLSTLFCETLNSKVTNGGRFVTQLTLSARRTDASGSSLWPTADASIFNDGQSVEAYLSRKQRERSKGYNGNGGGTPLAMAARLEELGLWPTATSRDAHGSRRSTARTEEWKSEVGTTLLDAAIEEKDLWATPRSSEWKDTGPVGSKSQEYMLEKHYLCAQAQEEEKLWASPVARNAHGAKGVTARATHGGEDPVSQLREEEKQPRALLNPDWVECLMGFPIGWTDTSGPLSAVSVSTAGNPLGSAPDDISETTA